MSTRGHDAAEKFTQLSSLVDFYNKSSSNHGLSKIDWDTWEEEIHTPHVVSKIRAKYNEFMQSEYDVEDAASRVNSQTDKLEALDVAVTYNYALWMCHYFDHVSFKEGLTNLGDINDMSVKEVSRHAPQIDLYHSMNMEIGDITPEDYNENGVANRLITQFSWGSRSNPPFVHSSDSLNSVAATLGKLGK